MVLEVNEPRPTEYRGTVFRSKSEALFARTLDEITESGGNAYAWIYEPKALALCDGYVPDFVLMLPATRHGSLLIAAEFKPRMPSKQYFKEFKSRADLMLEKCPLLEAVVIVVGNFYEGSDGLSLIWMDSSQSMNWIGRRHMDAAKKFRFDLAGSK